MMWYIYGDVYNISPLGNYRTIDHVTVDLSSEQHPNEFECQLAIRSKWQARHGSTGYTIDKIIVTQVSRS